jgi:hypothetical protein
MMNETAIKTRTPEAIEADRIGWRQRREQLAADLAGVLERQAAIKATLGALVTSQDPDARALKDSRTQRAGLALEREELDAGLAVAEGRLLELEAELRAAERRVRDLAAVDLVDNAIAAAGVLDAAWTPAVARLLDVVKAQREAADALGRLRPGNVFHIDDRTLLRVLLHRMPELGGVLGFADVSERMSVEAYLTSRYARARQELVNGGVTQAPPQEAPAREPAARVSRPRAPLPADRDTERCVEDCAEPGSCTGEVCAVTRTRVAVCDQQNRPAGMGRARSGATN